MSKRDNEEFNEEFNEDEDIKEEEDDYEIPDEDIADTETDINSDNMAETPMGLAHQISKESEVVKKFKELPREVKYSFYDTQEKSDVKHYARTYRTWKYIEKIIDLRTMEDNNVNDNRQDLMNANSKSDLIEYLKKNNRDYLINDIEDLDEDEIKKMIEHLKIIKENYFMDSVENRKHNIKEIYEEFNEENDLPAYIDDMGNLGKIMDTSVASMGFKGNAAQHSVMTINAVKNEDIQKSVEEKTKFSLLDSIRRKLG